MADTDVICKYHYTRTEQTGVYVAFVTDQFGRIDHRELTRSKKSVSSSIPPGRFSMVVIYEWTSPSNILSTHMRVAGQLAVLIKKKNP